MTIVLISVHNRIVPAVSWLVLPPCAAPAAVPHIGPAELRVCCSDCGARPVLPGHWRSVAPGHEPAAHIESQVKPYYIAPLKNHRLYSVRQSHRADL